jgi:hypothetical protein
MLFAGDQKVEHLSDNFYGKECLRIFVACRSWRYKLCTKARRLIRTLYSNLNLFERFIKYYNHSRFQIRNTIDFVEINEKR